MVSFAARLSPPAATIDVWFLNDGGVNGLDRNADVLSIEMTKLDEPR